MSRGTAGNAGALVERDREFEAIEQVLGGAIGGVGALLLLEGGAGLGKSSLLRWATGRARDLGMSVLSARSAEPEGEFPFAVVLQLFDPWLARATESERARAFEGAAGLAEPLFDPRGWQNRRPPEGEQALLHGLHWLTANLAERQPLLLCVDDAHWADRSSLGFFRYLAQRLEQLPIALVMGARPSRQAEHREHLLELVAEPALRSVELRPLTEEGVKSLVRASIEVADESDCKSFFAATGGNPLFVNELLRAVRDGDLSTVSDVAALSRLELPTIALHVLVRLARLGEAPQRLASAIAVLGDGEPLRRARALASLGDAAGHEAVEALLDEGLLSMDERGLVTFEHPIVREAIYTDLSMARRNGLHLSAANLLHEEGADVERVATHLLNTPPAGERWAVETLVHSARRARDSGAPEVTVRYLHRALAESLPEDEHAELLIELAQAEVMAGEPAAVVHFEEALHALPAGLARARALGGLGRALMARGRHGEALAWVERSLDEVPLAEEALVRELSAAYVMASTLATIPAPFDRVQAVLERPVGSETGGELSVLAALSVQEAFAGAPARRVRELAGRAWAEGRLLSEEGWGGESWSLVTGALAWSDDFTLAETVAREALKTAQAEGSRMTAASAAACLAHAIYPTGRLTEALAYAEQALESRDIGWEAFVLLTAHAACNIHMDRGDLGAAGELLELCKPLAAVHEDQNPAQVAYFYDARGRLRSLQDRPVEALEDHLLAGRIVSVLTDNPAVVPWRSRAALVACRLGNSDQAHRLVNDALDRALPTEAPRAIARPLCAAGVIEGGEAGLAKLQEAVELLETVDASVELVHGLFMLGAALRRAGKRSEARRSLLRGLEVADRCGAGLLVNGITDELRLTGARVRRTRVSGVGALTPSELRVATMASDGLSNREIAQALFVSVHAIDKHLRNAYQKLAINSRRDLARALAQPQ